MPNRYQLNHAPPVRHRRTALLWIILVAITVLGMVPRTAAAHARLLESDPASGSALAAMPAALTLQFSEEVDLGFSAASLVTVLDEPIGLGPMSVSDDRLTLTIPVADPASAAAGTYTLVWRVLSAKDGHVTTGTISFSAGTGVAPVVGSSSELNRPPWWRIGFTWLQLCLLITLGGSFLFALTILRSRLDLALPNIHERLVKLALLLIGLQFVMGYDLGISATGSRFFEPPSPSIYRDLLTETTAGRAWAAITVLVLTMLAMLSLLMRKRDHFLLLAVPGAVAALGCLFARSIAGHASATATPWRSIGIDWLHLSAVTWWLGGLPFLWLITRRTTVTTERAAVIIGRFSRFALALMAVIIATGFLRASDHVAGTRSLLSTDYGRTLIAKHLLLGPILISAAANLLVVVPRLKRAATLPVPAARQAALKSTRHFLSAEIASAALLLVAAAALTEFAPADGPLAVDVATRPVTFDERQQAGDLDVWLLARLTGASTDRITITVADAGGDVPADLQKVIISTSTTVNGEEVGDRFDAQQLSGSNGVYVFPALRLGLRGVWDVEIDVRRAGVEDVTTSFALDTTNTGAQPPRLVEDSWRMPRFPWQSWFFFAVAIVILVGGIAAIRVLPGIEPFAVGIMLTMIALIVTGFAVQGYRKTIPVSAGSNLANPVAADAGSIQRGSDLYLQTCIQCHGPGGGGIDQKDPDHLHPGGTNLTDSRTTQQRDGDLFWAISNGIGGTDMPAFDDALTESERWDLVNYLRTLRPVDAERALDATPE